MDLSQKNPENLEYMMEEIKKKLKMAAVGAIKSSHYSMEQYDDIKDIYEMVIVKTTFSINEMEALARELGQLRKA